MEGGRRQRRRPTNQSHTLSRVTLSAGEASKRLPNQNSAKPPSPCLIPPRAREAPFCFPRVRGKPPSDSPACGGSPLLIPPHAGERKGAVMLSEAKHLESRPTKTPRSHQTPRLTQRLSRPRAGAVREPPLLRFAAAQNDRVRQGTGDPAALQSGASLDSSLPLRMTGVRAGHW